MKHAGPPAMDAVKCCHMWKHAALPKGMVATPARRREEVGDAEPCTLHMHVPHKHRCNLRLCWNTGHKTFVHTTCNALASGYHKATQQTQLTKQKGPYLQSYRNKDTAAAAAAAIQLKNTSTALQASNTARQSTAKPSQCKKSPPHAATISVPRIYLPPCLQGVGYNQQQTA